MSARGRGGQEGRGGRRKGGHRGRIVERDGQKTMSTLAHRWQWRSIRSNRRWHGIALFLFITPYLRLAPSNSFCAHPVFAWHDVDKKVKLVRLAERLCDVCPRQRPPFVRIRDDECPRGHL